MNEQAYIAFENYLSNEMPQQERLEFENQLKNDAKMQQQFEAYKETTQFLSTKFDAEAFDFRKNLESISNQNFTETKQKTAVITFKPWVYSVAATVVLAIGIWFMTQGNPEYSDFNQHENASFVERGTADKNLSDAQNAFNQKDYKKAVASFEKVRDFSSPEVQYFYAVALIETNDFQKAEQYLNYIRSGNSVYKDKATWYAALSNLKQRKFDICKIYLHSIPKDAEDYEKAQKLLKDLD